MQRWTTGLVCGMILGLSLTAWATPAIDLERIVVTNARSQQLDTKVTSNVSVISQEQIQAMNAQSVPDVLQKAQGINLYDNSTSKTAIVDIRGFGDTASRNVLVLVNGRKVNPIDVSGPDLEQIPVGAIERIEILRGAGSVLYGDNAVGGVVNIITKKGKGALSGNTGLIYGSYEALGEHLELSGSRNKWSYYFYSKYFNKNGYRVNSEELSKDFNMRVGYEFGEQLTSDLETGWHKDHFGLPGGLTDLDLGALGRRGSSNPDDFSETKDRYVKLGINAKPSVSAVELGEVSVDVLYRNRDTYDEFNTFGPFHTKRAIDTYGVTSKYVFNRTMFNRDIHFVTGVDYYDYTNDIIGSGDNVDNITISKKEMGVYDHFQYEMFPHLFASTGTRYSQASYEFNQHNVIVDAKRTPKKWVNSGGIKYEYNEGSNIHFNWDQTFRFLATDEWYSTANFPGFGITPGLNLALKQQSGVQYEAGIKHTISEGVTWDLTPYWMITRNEIYFDPVTFGNNNYDTTHRGGIEFGQKVNVLKWIPIAHLDRFDWMTNYTYQDAQFAKGSNGGKRIPMVPEHTASESFDLGFLKYYNIILTAKYVGSRFAINDVRNEIDPVKPYFVCDTKLLYRRKNFDIGLSVNNLFDRAYSNYVAKSTFSSTRSYFPSPGRNFGMQMDMKF